MEKGITVVGLGPGSAGHLSLETMAVLKSGGKVILRTAVHPVSYTHLTLPTTPYV